MAYGASNAVIGPVSRFLRKLPNLSAKRILLGLSGGADSVALLHALAGLRLDFGYGLACAHLNHGLRGAESDRDESFVRDLCRHLGLDLTVERACDLARQAGNLEARARIARQRFLDLAAARLNADYVALAHHADDQAETVVLRLLRGTGITGLGAMADVGPGKVIRPMLQVGRVEILDYLAEIGASFVEDSTNRSSRYDRNRVRHVLMPLLEGEFAPGLTGRLVELAAEMRQVDELLGELAGRALDECLAHGRALDLERLSQVHPALGPVVLRRYLALRVGDLRGIGRSHIQALGRLAAHGPPNGSLALPDGWYARRRYGRLVIERNDNRKEVAAAFEITLAVCGCTRVEPARTIFESRLIAPAQVRMPHDQFAAVFDAHRLGSGLIVRNFVAGDRISPLGLNGSRKVKDIFIEHRIARDERPRFPVVVAEGRVVWLPGLVRSDRALITDRTTEVLQVTARGNIA